MEDQKKKQRKKVDRSVLDGFSPVSSARIDWKSRKRSSSASGRNKVRDDDTATETTPNKQETTQPEGPTEPPPELSERRKALFEPLEPMTNLNGHQQLSAEALLPPPDFDAASYPRGWLIGKKRKLVNIDVVESMRRIAIQEMNRKDREIGELNDILDEDSKVLEIVQKQLLEERGKTAHLERENTMLREQVKMLMGLLEEDEQAMDVQDEQHKGDGSNEP